jgi:cytochrome c biogenesis factor
MTTTQDIVLSITALITFLGTLAPLVWAAIQDGRYEASQHAA